MRQLFALALLLGLMAMPAVAEDRESAMLRAVLAEGPLDLTLFSDAFLRVVPAPQIEPLVADIKKTIGPVLAVVSKGGTSFLVETATHERSSEPSTRPRRPRPMPAF